MRTWLRGILSILLAAGLLVSCSKTLEISDNPNERESRLSGTTLFWYGFPQSDLPESLISKYREVLLQSSIRKFTKIYPQVKIIMELIKEEELVEELERKVEKGLGPDLIYTQSIYILPLIQAKALLPLDKYSIDLSKFRPEALAQVIYQDQLYGLPLDLGTQVLCYNKKKVKKLPETLSELITQARTGYSVGMLSNFSNTFWGIQIFGGQLLDAQGRIVLDRGGGWVQWMKWLINAKNEPNFILSEDSFVLQNAFIQEKLAYQVCWSFQIPFLQESLGSDKLGVALLPGGENRQAAPPLVVSGLLFSSVSSPAQTQIALRFAQFLANTQQQKALAKFQSFVPANTEAIIDPRLFPIQGILEKQSQEVTAFSLDETEKINAISKYGEELYTRVMAGEISPEQAASQLTQIINSQFEEP